MAHLLTVYKRSDGQGCIHRGTRTGDYAVGPCDNRCTSARPGGGEGIRTPDPITLARRPSQASIAEGFPLLCPLSYAARWDGYRGGNVGQFIQGAKPQPGAAE